MTEAPHHNALTCYVDYKCRRPECTERYNAANRARRRAQAAGTWNKLVDAAPVREHLLALHARGITRHRVATLSGVDVHTVRRITHHTIRLPRRHRVHPAVAEKILAVSLDTATPGYVDATGTRRRLQALIAVGWPLEPLAPRIGVSPRNIWSLTQRAKVRATTAHRACAVYEELRNQKPTRHGISARHARDARARASANRWPTPAYWDDSGAIDDADFIPDYKVTRLEIVAEEAHFLITTAQLSTSQAAERLGISTDYVYRALTAHPQKEAA